jgi:eukaryotic-like serine/threonine-protein kinase
MRLSCSWAGPAVLVRHVGAPWRVLVSSSEVVAATGPAASGGVTLPGDMHRIGDYEVVRKIAAGGTGTVYLARHRGPAGFAKLVALKLLHPHLEMGDEERRRFIAEARIGAELAHPNVVDVLNLATHEGELYMVMEYVRGCDLRTLIKAHAPTRLPARASVAILVEVLSGLGAAHGYCTAAGERQPVIHRDLKPRNILIAASGEVKVTDFGTALIGGETRGSSLRGTFAYMSPEQARGELVDARTDLFSAGLVLYELVTGRMAYAAAGDIESLRLAQQATIDWRPVATQPLRLRRALEQALAPSREDRFPDAATMRLALLDYLAETGPVAREELAVLVRPHVASEDDPASETAPTRPDRATRTDGIASTAAPQDGDGVSRAAHRRLAGRVALAVGLGLLVAGASGWLWHVRRAPSPPATVRGGADAAAPLPAASSTPAVLDPPAVAVTPQDDGGTPNRSAKSRQPRAVKRPSARLGSLVLNTIPTWSTVRIDQGAPLTTPVHVKVPEGRHAVTIQPAGQGRTLKVWVDVSAGHLTKKIVDVTVAP